MSEKAYIRNPNGQRGGPGEFGTNDQDLEDFEQEELIRQWLEREGKSGSIELQYRSRKGTARNTLLKAQRLDSPIGEDGTRTLADIVAGSDGRDLECGSDSDGIDEGPETAIDCLGDVLEIADLIISFVKTRSVREEIRRIYHEYIERSLK